jgi:hypothetical protein
VCLSLSLSLSRMSKTVHMCPTKNREDQQSLNGRYTNSCMVTLAIVYKSQSHVCMLKMQDFHKTTCSYIQVEEINRYCESLKMERTRAVHALDEAKANYMQAAAEHTTSHSEEISRLNLSNQSLRWQV